MTVDMREMSPARPSLNPGRFAPSLAAAEYAWARTPSSTRGVELILSALSHDPHNKNALSAAQSLVDDEHSSSIASAFAHRFVELPSLQQSTLVPADVPPSSLHDSRARIRYLRKRTRRWPRNALTWVDLARAYFVLGQDDQAQRSLEVGLALDNDNRFVVRSAVRFLVHQGDEERAAAIVGRAAGSDTDPWLQGVTVALGSGGRGRSLRHSLQLVEDGSLAPWHVAELGAALATSEYEHGQARRARQLMRRALIDPTENALAHAEWAKQLGLEASSDSHLPRAPHEALARRHAHRFEWHEAAQWARMWVEDEPFSVLASSLGSWYAIESGDFEAAIQMSSIGLVANSGDLTLVNNRAFALACAWRLEEAGNELLRADLSKGEAQELGCLLATAGFVTYRAERMDEGRELYERAIRLFTSRRDYTSGAHAAVNLAAEDVRTRSEHAAQSTARASELVERSRSLEIADLWHRVQMRQRLGPEQPSGWTLLQPATEVVAQLPSRMEDARDE